MRLTEVAPGHGQPGTVVGDRRVRRDKRLVELAGLPVRAQRLLPSVEQLKGRPDAVPRTGERRLVVTHLGVRGGRLGEQVARLLERPQRRLVLAEIAVQVAEAV